MAAPILQALLVADQIYQDQSTGKFVICGIFGTIFFLPPEGEAPGAPGSQGSPGLTGSQGSPPVANSGGGNRESAGAGTSGHSGGISHASGSPQSPPSGSHQMPLNRFIRAGSPSAYVSLTEINGQRSFELRYADLKENTVLFSVEFKVECRNPLETVQLTLPLPVLPVPHEGVFVLELLCEGELLGSHRIMAKRQPRP
jgi:hypothetical protein